MSDNPVMPESARELQFNREFGARLRQLRSAKEWTQDQMAEALGIPKDRYAKYENRPKSAMPAYLIPQFARIVGHDIEYVLTGKRNLRRPTPKVPRLRKVG